MYKKTDLRISFLNFNFSMIYIIHKILVLIKNRLLFFKKYIYIFKIYNNEKSKG